MSKLWSDLKVGDTVWLFESDRRRLPGYYAIDWDRRDKFQPTFYEHWVPHKIEAGTKVSWVVNGRKFPKRARAEHPTVLITIEEVGDATYVHENKRVVARVIESFRDNAENAEPLRFIIRALENMGVQVR